MSKRDGLVKVYPEVLEVLRELQSVLKPKPYLKELVSALLFEAFLNPAISYTVFRNYFNYSDEASRKAAWKLHDMAINLVHVAMAHEEAEKQTIQDV